MPEEYEFTAPGKMTKNPDGGFNVRYEETTDDGDSFVNMLKTAADGTAEIKRYNSDTYRSEFYLDRERKHLCMINTELGDICLGVLTHTIQDKLSPAGGSLYLRYSLDANNHLRSENEVSLQVDVT
jgi:uncharacterized beta-barrel protein YwiB (DUF1934 family)